MGVSSTLTFAREYRGGEGRLRAAEYNSRATRGSFNWMGI
jgi:hypothetical protein